MGVELRRVNETKKTAKGVKKGERASVATADAWQNKGRKGAG